jgi:glycerate kinase
LAAIELVVTGCTSLDFARRGGGVVAGAAHLAGDRLAPCIAVAGEVLIGSRELRTMGIESAYALRGSDAAASVGGDVTETELGTLARRIGRSWRW